MFLQADATRLPFADDTFDITLTSPPYQDARTFGIRATRHCLTWIDWMLDVVTEAVRVTKGLVLVNCAGVTRRWKYQPGPEGLLFKWYERGGFCWRPAFWRRDGIPGSGGNRRRCRHCKGKGCGPANLYCSSGLSSDPAGDAPQWLRANIEYVLCFTKCPSRLPYSDALANGHPPKLPPGGNPSHRTTNGERVNGKDAMGFHAHGGRGRDGDRKTPRYNPTGPNRRANGVKKTTRRCTRGKRGGDTIQETLYVPPDLANPGCLIQGIPVGGGLMGHKLAHENEAPFPLKLAQWFIRGWCPPGGLVLDQFSGSGTTVHAALSLGRRAVGCDLRLSQCKLGRRRCDEVQKELFG